MRLDPETCISGVGTLGGFGIGLEALARALEMGEPLSLPVDRSARFHREDGARRAALVPQLDLKPYVSPVAARRMSASSLWAVATAKMALTDAGVGEAILGDLPLAVDIANVFGPSRYTEQLLQQVLQGDPQLASPFLFTDCVANAPAGQVAIALGARGSNTTWCEREAGQLLALLASATVARDGRPRRVLCGVVDEMPPVVHAILDRFHALATGDPELPRPFCADRNGFCAGEGATLLLLEPTARAKRPLARVLAGGRAFDPSARPIGWGEGDRELAEAIESSLTAHSITMSSVDAVICSASGSIAGDRLEAQVLKRLFGGTPPPLLVPKAVIGEFGGGVLAAGLLALAGASFKRPVGCTVRDERLGLLPHDGFVRARRVLITAFAAGGAAAWTVLGAM